MKKLIFAALMLLSAFTMSAALTALHIHTASRGVVTLLLEDEPELTFNEDRSITVEVTSPSAEPTEPINLSFDDVEGCTYGDANDYVEDGVSSAVVDNDNEIVIHFDGNLVIFDGVPQSLTAEVYSLNGTKVANVPAMDGTVSLDRSTLGRGVYIVRIGTFVTKLSF